MQQVIMQSEIGFDNVTEVTIPVLGVVVKITPVAEHADGSEDFVLSVADEDTGGIFKTIESRDLMDLIERQHRLIQAFSK
jgi:hypothetical protein